MRTVAGSGEKGPIVSSAVVLAALAILAFTVLTGLSTREVTLVVLMLTTVTVAYRWLLTWRALLALMILIILFIPIRRYTMPGDLPFAPEPYRAFVALLVGVWLASMLVDPRVRLRRTGFEGPFALIAVAAFASILANPGRVALLETDVVKKLMFLASFLLIVYVIVSVVRRYEVVDQLIKVIVAGGAVVAAFAIVEARTGYNPFNHLSGVIPALRPGEILEAPQRGARLRVYASAQHPIALGAALVMLAPLALYLAQRYRRASWWICALVLGVGCLATVSRTGILMLGVVAVVFLWLRPRETRRFWPALLPALIVVHFALPGTIGSLKQSFLPEGGLIAEQSSQVGGTGQGRIADLGPALTEWKAQPLSGQGFGTRVVDAREGGYAQILDNQWLATLLETGVIGLAAWIWLFWRVVRRFGAASKRDDSARGWLLASIAASIAAYATGMLTYDAFSFIQVTFLAFILIGLGASLLGEGRRAEAVHDLRGVARSPHGLARA